MAVSIAATRAARRRMIGVVATIAMSVSVVGMSGRADAKPASRHLSCRAGAHAAVVGTRDAAGGGACGARRHMGAPLSRHL